MSGLTGAVSAISVGDNNGYGFACALHAGVAKCWGSNSDGQLGQGGTGDGPGSTTPVANFGPGAQLVAAGRNYTLVLTS